MKILKVNFLATLISVALLLGLFSCNDKPVSIGMEFLPDTVSVITLDSQNDALIEDWESYWINIPIFNSGAFLVGKSGDIQAASILRFAGFPRDLAYLEAEDIVSATITIHPGRYAYGDTVGGSFAFRVVQMNEKWERETPTYDEIFLPPYTFFDYDKVVGRWESNITLQDTMPAITIELTDKQTIINKWFRLYESPPDTVEWGMAFIAEPSTSVIHQFGGVGLAIAEGRLPYATVIYKNSEGELDTLNLQSAISASYATAPKPPDDFIAIQGAITYRSKFKFDITKIPQFAGIHKTQFELYLDSSQCLYGNHGIDSVLLMAYYLRPESEQQPFLEFIGRRQGTSDRYLFSSVSSALEVWNRESGIGYLILEPYGVTEESHRVDRLVFWGTNAPDPTKRPKLKVYYSILK